jgi:recombination protein RecA
MKSLKQVKLFETGKTDNEDKKKALDKALHNIDKEFGKGAIMRMGDKANTNIETLSTGVLSVDIALGVGGLPRGRVTEIFGPESSGKTTLALQAVAEAQKNGYTAAYIDAENALDPSYAKNLGVNLDELLISQPGGGEEGLEIANKLVESGAIDIVVIDSVAALVPRAEIEGEIGDNHVGLQARLMSQALRKMTSAIYQNHVVVIFINQLREKVGVMFGSPETTPGGRALKFYASVRLDVRRTQAVKDGKDQIGNGVRIKVVKNKVASPFKKVETVMSYGYGIRKNDDMLAIAVNAPYEVIKKSGSWYSYNDDRIGQGANNAARYLDSHPTIAKEVEQKIRAIAFPKNSSTKDDKEDSK